MSRPEEGLRLPPTLAIVGPTASGKSRFALRVAEALGGEVLSCDSMAVFRGMDIGTDKPPAADRTRIPHHLIDLAEPGSTFSAGAFRAAALQAMEDMAGRGVACVVVGGTGLYYRALTEGLVDLPPRDEPLRERLRARIHRRGAPAAHRLLGRLDPASAGRILPGDALRIVRALEVRLLTGEPLSAWIARAPFGASRLEGVLKIGLTAPRETLYARIDARVDQMVAAGLPAEVEGLLRAGVLRGTARKAIGYGEMADHLEGRCSLEVAVDRVKLRSRHLAKRQLAWFRKEPGIRWYDVSGREAWSDESMEFIKRWNEKTRPFS
jgi:tRNA dimethylallyltransferase